MKSSICLIFVFVSFVKCGMLRGFQKRPPMPKHVMFEHDEQKSNEIRDRIDEWSPDDENHVWEMSGLHEGDIMLYPNEMNHLRNGLLEAKARWPDATVPYYIEEDDFSDEEQLVILKAFKEYHNKTCIKFRPYHKNDKNWIIMRGNSSGCWSSVGMKNEGQIVHLQSPGCVKHGVVIHELLHALGFYHQQSASNRDDYVKILWDNISDGHEHNFNKYNTTVVTNYGIDYDYGSVMHYSKKAFSKNDEDTIQSLQPNTTLGQRKGLSEKDLIKLDKMYKTECQSKKNSLNEDEEFNQQFDALLEYLSGNFY